MPYNSRAGVVRLLAERYDTKSNVKLCEFRSHLQASYESSHFDSIRRGKIEQNPAAYGLPKRNRRSHNDAL